mmetsp:Transcript_7461/g.18989  ORF Transcript_7461/g.18989 Transcript_7461/m.18989 type:complete len:256 (-) Transcript_7461:1126-1893(-)
MHLLRDPLAFIHIAVLVLAGALAVGATLAIREAVEFARRQDDLLLFRSVVHRWRQRWRGGPEVEHVRVGKRRTCAVSAAAEEEALAVVRRREHRSETRGRRVGITVTNEHLKLSGGSGFGGGISGRHRRSCGRGNREHVPQPSSVERVHRRRMKAAVHSTTEHDQNLLAPAAGIAILAILPLFAITRKRPQLVRGFDGRGRGCGGLGTLALRVLVRLGRWFALLALGGGVLPTPSWQRLKRRGALRALARHAVVD